MLLENKQISKSSAQLVESQEKSKKENEGRKRAIENLSAYTETLALMTSRCNVLTSFQLKIHFPSQHFLAHSSSEKNFTRHGEHAVEFTLLCQKIKNIANVSWRNLLFLFLKSGNNWANMSYTDLKELMLIFISLGLQCTWIIHIIFM